MAPCKLPAWVVFASQGFAKKSLLLAKGAYVWQEGSTWLIVGSTKVEPWMHINILWWFDFLGGCTCTILLIMLLYYIHIGM